MSSAKGEKIAQTLKENGYNVVDFRQSEVSGIHLIVVLQNRLDGAADKRREGKVRTLKD
jgi:gamma-glutamyltranspeptidase/glutathione hydrolase